VIPAGSGYTPYYDPAYTPTYDPGYCTQTQYPEAAEEFTFKINHF